MNPSMTKTLNNGVAMPMLGLGVWRAKDDVCARAVAQALEDGYRHIDTAAIYGNEAAVGRGIKDSGVPRKEIFITTKLWNEDMRAGRQAEAFEQSLEKLGTDYVDLYLLHWPVDKVFIPSWKILERIYKSGRAKAIGISNFHAHHLEPLLAEASVVPAVNQFECHPYLSQEPLMALCAKHGIACAAYSPLGGKGSPVLEDPALAAIAAKHGKSPAQIVLRWNVQRGVIVLPKSVQPERIAANGRLFDFSLDDADMAAVNALNQNRRLGFDPDNFDF